MPQVTSASSERIVSATIPVTSVVRQPPFVSHSTRLVAPLSWAARSVARA
jgi:hypothetical protein